MQIIVSHIYGSAIEKMRKGGWDLYDNPIHADSESQVILRRISGCEMIKDCASLGEAMRDFEKITGFDAISDSSQDGAAIYLFTSPDEQICAGGWQCGKYLYKNWFKTPRECLEALNK